MAELGGSFGEKEILQDNLDGQKHICNLYNMAAGECATAGLQSEMLTLLGEEHKLQLEVFQEMQKRGWYPTPAAQAEKLQQAKEQFSGGNS